MAMQKHVTLVGVLNIVYRSMIILEAGVLVALGFWFEPLMWTLMRSHTIRPHEVPFEVLDFVPLILFIIAAVIVFFSILGIIGAIGVLKRKEWGRILLLVISFFHLARVPLGTILGVYSIWVLLSDETIRLFNPAPDRPVSSAS
jgi:hypothetical protein